MLQWQLAVLHTRQLKQNHEIGMVALDSTEEQIMNHSDGKRTEVFLHLQEMFIKSSEHLNKEE